jgi:hypothetical protein
MGVSREQNLAWGLGARGNPYLFSFPVLMISAACARKLSIGCFLPMVGVIDK